MSTWAVVEDEPDIFEVLLAMFEMWGVEGVAFVDGEEAVAWIEDVEAGRYTGELPELWLLDIRLPGEINGITVAEKIRRTPQLRHAAIVVTTASKLTVEEEQEQRRRSKCDAWIWKPLPKFSDLQGVLEGIIARKSPPRKG